jgi:hypothetical protein
MTVGGTMVTHVDTMYNPKFTSPFMYSLSIFLATQACTENSPKVTACSARFNLHVEHYTSNSQSDSFLSVFSHIVVLTLIIVKTLSF